MTEDQARMDSADLLNFAMAHRAERGLALVFEIPGREDAFTCYPRDNAQKAKWLADAADKGWTLLNGPDTDQNVATLSAAFIANVRATLNPEQLADVNRLNKRDADLPVCHTHDYYDANESMIAAFDQTFGRDANPRSEHDATLINKAWSLAKSSGFATQVPFAN